MTFALTPAAAARILQSAVDSGIDDASLRVAAKRGPDGEMAYGMGFDDLREGDMPLELQGVRLLIGAPSQPLLQGTQLDFVEIEPGRFEFIFVPDGAAAEPPPRSGCGSGGCSSCSS
jgi:iron-sulfur cluster assembly protein